MERSVSVYSILLLMIAQMRYLLTTPLTEMKEAVGMEVDINDLKFKYYNRNYRENPFIINITDEGFADELRKLWNYQEILKIITHGWISSETSQAVADVKDAYLIVHAFNVITLDWSYTAATKNYVVPAVMTHQVGILAAQVIDKLVELEFIQYDRVHMIGHSLGSHVSGATGAHCKNKIARVTGLDPAGPGFHMMLGDDMRLDKTDAQFVDVIHTAAGSAGFLYPLGHADFYPNSGKPPQPGCMEFSMNIIDTFSSVFGCSHMRSYEFFIESIRNPEAFKSERCDSWSDYESGSCNTTDTDVQYMGEPCSPTARGVYYLATNAKSPYTMTKMMSDSMADIGDSVKNMI